MQFDLGDGMLFRVISVLAIILCYQCIGIGVNLVNSQEAQMKKVGIFAFRVDDSYINLVVKSIEQALQGKAEVTVFDAKQDKVSQFDQLNSFIESGGDAIAMNLVDVKSGRDVLNIIRAHDLPVVFFNKEPDPNSLLDYPKARFVGSLVQQSALLQGEIISKLWEENPQFDRNNDKVCNFIMLQGNVDNPEGLVRSKIAVQGARKHGVNMQQIGDTIICDWDEDCAYKATKLALNTFLGKLDMIISNNDSMALGAIKALQDYNFNIPGGENIIPVVGIDGIKQAKEAISQGIMHGTVIQDAQSMGYAVGTMLFNMINDKAFLEGLPYKWGDSGIDIRIPYQEYKPEN